VARIDGRTDRAGVGIAYELRTDAGSEAPWLVLIHGLGYARWGWEPVTAALGERYRLVLLDNRGIGESDAPPGPYTTADLADDVVAVLDDTGIETAAVLATSLGGMVGQELAIRHPERVDALVLVCTTPGGDLAHPFPEPTQRLLAELPQMDPRAGLERAVRNALSEDAPQELVDRIVGYRVAAPPDPVGWQAQAGAAGAHDAGDRLDRIDAPTLVVHGTADVVVDPRNAAVLGERIPDAAVVLLDGLGHLLFWEDPAGFLEPVVGFLARHVGTS
jgi:3-oxoadipate enol-lactonase